MSTQIADTENALLDLLRECQLPSQTHIGSAPSRWDMGFIQRLIPTTPAVLISFLGAEPHADRLQTSLNLNASWGVYAVIGWNGNTQEQRRLAVDGGYDIVGRVAPILHNAPIMDPAQQRLPFPQVTKIEVLTDSSVDVSNLWVCEMLVEIELPLEIPEPCIGPLDDFLRVRGPLVVPDPADDIDIAVDLPQS